ncbi:MAG: TspO/MBR family protein [Chthoniobacterales bacterium]
MTSALLYALLFCAAGAALEGLFAGRGIRQRMAELRFPRYAPPFWGWLIIGGLYYVICFAVLYRLFGLPRDVPRDSAIGLAGAVMFINALWNYFFFRTRNLFHAYMLSLAYGAMAIALFLLLLLGVDRTAAWCLFPYLFYLGYASVWGYRTWKLNARG